MGTTWRSSLIIEFSVRQFVRISLSGRAYSGRLRRRHSDPSSDHAPRQDLTRCVKSVIALI